MRGCTRSENGARIAVISDLRDGPCDALRSRVNEKSSFIGYDGIRNAADGGRNTRQTSSCCFEIDEPKALHLS